MDIVHHSLVGTAGFLVASAHQQELVGLAFLAASVFPDLDVAFMAFGKRFYLKHHQGITHSVALSPLYAMLIASPLIYAAGFDWAIFAAALIGLWVHIGLDLSNTFRIGLLSPFSAKRYSLDAVFFIDSVALGLTGLFFVLYAALRVEAWAYIYPALFVCYLIAKGILQRRVKKTLGCSYAIPSSFNPFEFYILEQTQTGALSSYLYNAATRKSRDLRHYEPASERCRALAETSSVFTDMRRITRHLHITDVKRTSSGTTLQAADLAIRNFGGKFGQTTLAFDHNGALVHEMANL